MAEQVEVIEQNVEETDALMSQETHNVLSNILKGNHTEPSEPEDGEAEIVVQNIVLPTEDPIAEPKVETEPDEPIFKLSEIKSRFENFNNLDELKESYDTLSKSKGVYDEASSLLSYIENPHANDTVASFNEFVKRTGISDLQVASMFMGKDINELMNQPIKFIAIADIMANPGILKTKSFTDYMDGLAEKYDVSVDVPLAEVSKSLSNEVAAMRTSMEEKWSAKPDALNPLSMAREKVTQQNLQRETNAKGWELPINSVNIKDIEVSLDPLEKDLPALSFKIPVSEDVMKEVRKGLMDMMKSNGLPFENKFSEPLLNIARDRARSLMTAEIIKSVHAETVKAYRGIANEDAVKRYHNQQAVVSTEPAPAKPKGAQEEAKSTLTSILRGTFNHS